MLAPLCGASRPYRYVRATLSGAFNNVPLLLLALRLTAAGTPYPWRLMTGPSAPPPMVATADVDSASAWRAFGAIASSSRWSAPYLSGGTLTLDLGARVLPRPTTVAITSMVSVGALIEGEPPRNATIRISPDGSAWTTLLTATEIPWSRTDNVIETKTWTV